MLSIAIFIIGLTSILAQIILIRELLIVFYGNELCIGFILASWLIWASVGSALLGRFSDRLKVKVSLLSCCFIFLSLILPLNILAIRAIRTIWGFIPGELIGFLPMAVSSLLILAPGSITLGFLFALGCRFYPAISEQDVGRIGKVYVLESIGAAVGGVAGSFFLIRYLHSLQIMVILGVIDLMAVFLLELFFDKSRWRIVLNLFILGLVFSNVSFFSTGGVNRLHHQSLREQWKGYNVIASRDSIYGNVTVVKEAQQNSFFVSGVLQSTIPDELSAEESVHFALLEHSSPKKVLLIGGGVGLLKELLKHPIQLVDYVELDPLIIAMSKDYLEPAYTKILENPRVRIRNIDGRLFVKQSKDKFDCIIVSVSNPSTAQLNRFYTLEFFQELKLLLNEGGLVSFGVGSSENYISDELKCYLSCLYKTVCRVFPQVKLIPGETVYFLCSDKKGTLTNDYKVLIERLKTRNIDAKFVREYYLVSRLSPSRIRYLEDTVTEFKSARLNRDFRPICYYYDVILWSARLGSKLEDIMKTVKERMLWILTAVVLSIILLSASLKRVTKRRISLLTAVATTGLSGMALQIVIIVSFQIIYGYLYYKLGIIIASFMVGLSLGAWWVTRAFKRLKDDYLVFIKTQIASSVYPLLLPFIFYFFSLSSTPTVDWLGRNVVFSFLPIISGFIGGFQYPLANKLYLKKRYQQIGQVAGLTYGLDLLGASLGALVVSTFFLPIIGIYKTCFIVALLNTSILVLLMRRL